MTKLHTAISGYETNTSNDINQPQFISSSIYFVFSLVINIYKMHKHFNHFVMVIISVWMIVIIVKNNVLRNLLLWQSYSEVCMCESVVCYSYCLAKEKRILNFVIIYVTCLSCLFKATRRCELLPWY